LRKVLFAVYFAVAFKKSATKLGQTRRQKIVSLYSGTEGGIVKQFTNLISKIFDSKFDGAFFEDHFDVLPSKITDAEFIYGLDLLIKGFMDLNDTLFKPESKDIIIFLASTIIPGGIVIPNFLTLFVGNRIRLSEQMVIAYGQNSIMEGLMSVTVYIYIQVFMNQYILNDYHDDKFIQILTQVIYHFLVSFFAKVVPTISQDEAITSLYIKTVYNLNLTSPQITTSSTAQARPVLYSGDDNPISGIPYEVSHERFLNNKKVVDRLQTRLIPTLRKTYDLLNQGVKAIKSSILKAKMDRILKLKEIFPKDSFYSVAEAALKDKTEKLKSK